MNSRLVVAEVVEKADYVLLGRKPKDTYPYPNTWLILGGGINLGKESAEDAIKREIREEANIDVEIIEQIGFDEDNEPNKNGEMTHYLFLIYRAKYVSGQLKPGSDILELKWFKKIELQKLKLNRASIRLFKTIGYSSSGL